MGSTSLEWIMMPLKWILTSGVLLSLVLYSIVLLLSHAPRQSTRTEKQYIAVNEKGAITEEPILLPTLEDEPKLEMSVVIPCYNETSRLGIMLEECVPVLNKEFGESWEILLVDDGSKDNTDKFALNWAIEHKLRPYSLKVSKLEKNRGKGGAVTHGMKYTNGKYVIYADADGASKFGDIKNLLNKLKQTDNQKLGISIGSRAHMVKTDAVVKRSFIRNFLMYGLHTLLYIFGIRTIGDTQCGFKLFTRDSIKLIFPFMHTEGWIFDVEVLILAMKKNVPIYEVPISWHEVEGSKIELARDSIKMAIDLIIMRFAYFFGIYQAHKVTIDSKKDK